MTNMEAVLVRVSNRKYLPRPLTEDEISQLEKIIGAANQASGLRMQLLTNCPEAFSSLRRSYGMFSGVSNLVALVGRSDLPHFREKCGYYGEKSCWGPRRWALAPAGSAALMTGRRCPANSSRGRNCAA